jgi:hypothetical protein
MKKFIIIIWTLVLIVSAFAAGLICSDKIGETRTTRHQDDRKTEYTELIKAQDNDRRVTYSTDDWAMKAPANKVIDELKDRGIY